VQRSGDQSLQAYALALPDYDTLSSAVGTVEPQALCGAIAGLRLGLATALAPELRAVYDACAAAEAAAGAYSPDPVSIGRRRLRDVCLGYLAALDTAETTALCMAQLKGARCITDSLAAFTAASGVSGPARLEASAHFAQVVKDDPLYAQAQAHARTRTRTHTPASPSRFPCAPPPLFPLRRGLDKWFRTRAGASVPTALAEVRELMSLPSFSMTNPNRVRAVVGAFTMLNHKAFHAADGSGYEFIAQSVIDLDKVTAAHAAAPRAQRYRPRPTASDHARDASSARVRLPFRPLVGPQINPQVAARLARSFSAWRRLSPAYGELMRAQLERLAKAEGLSRNTLEIVTMSLN
jgi:aminopeptidase N